MSQFGLDSNLLELKPGEKALRFRRITVIHTIKQPAEGDFRAQSKSFRRPSDLLFLTFHQEKPSPSGASIMLLSQ